MRRDLKNTLLVPTALAVAAFGPACGTDVPPTTSTSTGATESATGPTSGPTSTTRAPSTGASSTGSTGVGASSTGGELPDCSQYSDDANTCLSTIECLYLENEATCIVRCNYFSDQAGCEQQMYCYWLDGCYLAV